MKGWQYIDIAAVAIYLAICLAIGLYKANKIKTLKQFALGFKDASTQVLVSTILATAVGAGSTLGYTEKLYTLGIVFVITLLFQPLYWIITARIFANNIERFKGCLSVSQIMYKLYGKHGRWVTTICALVVSIGVVAAQASAIGYVFHYLFDIEVRTGIFISYSVLTLYSALGGIRAVVLTEVFQFALFFFIIPVSYAVVLNKIGGLEYLMQKLPLPEWGLEGWHLELNNDSIPLLISLVFYVLLPEVSAPNIQRYLMAPSSEVLRKSFKIIALISIPFTISLCLIAYIVRVLSPDINPKDVYLFYIMNYLPIGVSGLMIAGILAIIMSTAESFLNTSSVIIVNDIIKVLHPKISRVKQLIALRLFVIIPSVLSIFIALEEYGISNLIWSIQNFSLPLILVPLCAGFLGFKTNSKSFIASTITAIIFTASAWYIIGKLATISLISGVVGSALGLFGAHFLQVTNQRFSFKKLLINKLREIKQLKTIKFSNRLSYNTIKTLNNKTYIQHNLHSSFAGFTLIYYFIYTLYINADPAIGVLLNLLIVGYFLCMVLLLKDVMFSKNFQKKYFFLFWFCSVTFCLPVVSSYMLFASNGDDFWVINGLLSAFSLYFFVSALFFLISISTGAICGYLLYFLTTTNASIVPIKENLIVIGYIYFFFLFTTLFFVRNKEKGHEEQLEIMKMVGGAIAHEVKSPIATMTMCANLLSEILDKTLRITGTKSKKYIFSLTSKEYIMLQDVSKSLQQLGNKGIHTVNNILMSLKTSVIASDKKILSLKECLKQAIEEYAIYNKGVNHIELRIRENFKIYCSPYYFKHLILNLLTNAYKYNGPDVKIKIWTHREKLHFKDYGQGISPENLPHIFDRFYTKSETGTGIGLSFCKMVMEDLHGTIECKSKQGKYTEFILSFPKTHPHI